MHKAGRQAHWGQDYQIRAGAVLDKMYPGWIVLRRDKFNEIEREIIDHFGPTRQKSSFPSVGKGLFF